MIRRGDITLIDGQAFRCLRVDDEGYAHLMNVVNDSGRPRKILVSKCPFMKDGVLITPEPKKKTKIRISGNMNVGTLMKDLTERQVSREAVAFMKEWIETFMVNMMTWADNNAEERGDSRITAAHIYWYEMDPRHDLLGKGYWPSQNEYVLSQSEGVYQ